MNKNEKLDHMLALTEEVNILTQRIKPQATGYIHTTISTLRDRIKEIKDELSDRPVRLANSEEVDGMYTDDEMKEWDKLNDRKPPISIH